MYPKIPTFAFIFAIVILVIGLSGCEKMAPMVPDDTTAMPEMMAGEMPIGLSVELTGPYADPYGIPMQRGLELAREEINALGAGNFTFVTVDTQSTEEGTIASVQQLVDLGVPVIIGVSISDYLEDAFPIAQENGVIAFSPISAAAGLSGIGDYVFRTGLATDVLNPSGVMVTQEELGYTKVATIYDGLDPYSTSSNAEITKALVANGVEILTEEAFQTGDPDFSTQLTNIMDMEPDALFVSALAPDMVEIIVQAHAVGVSDSIPLIIPDVSSAEIQKAGAAAEGIITFTAWFRLADTPGNQTFIQNYRTKYGEEPSPWAAQSYATLYILANAIANAHSTDPAAIRDALAQTMDFPTILGDFSFDPNGEAMYDSLLLTVKDGELQLFETPMSQTMTPEIPIGLLTSLTGKHTEVYGLPMQRGFELAREEINMHSDANFTFITVDDQSTVEGAKAAVQQLVDQGVPAMVGFAISGMLKPSFPIAQENGVVGFSGVSSAAGLSTEIGDYIFRAALAVDKLVPPGVAATQQKIGYETAAIIYDATDEYSTSGREEFEKALMAHGVEILTVETMETGDTDVSTQLTNIKNLEPDALFVSTLSQEMTVVIEQARDPEVGIPDTVPFIVLDLTEKEIGDVGAAAEGAITFTAWFHESDTPRNQAFVQNYRAKYGIEPEPWAAQSYATFYILANAIANAQSTDSADIRDALAQTMNFPTILGNFSFDPGGEAVHDPIVLTVKNGKLQLFE